MSTKKKQTKKLKLANVTGRKKVMFITLFVFVAIGAGVIIRSFASTIIATVNADQIRIHPNAQYPPSTKISESVNGKAPINVWKVPALGTLQTTAPMSVPANTNYTVCYSVKGVGRFFGVNQYYGVSNGSSYQNYCGAVSNSGANGFSLQPTFRNENTSGDLYLQSIFIQTANTTTTPAPSK